MSVTDAIEVLEKRYGVTCDEFRAWLEASPCDAIPRHEVHRWIALLEVLDKGEQYANVDHVTTD